MNLLHYFRLRALNRRLRNCRSTSEYKSWNNIRTVLVLYRSDEREENRDLEPLFDRIRADHKQLSVCTFINKKEARSSSRDSHVVLDLSSIDLLGRPKSIAADRMIDEEEFDLVLDLTDRAIVPLQHFMLSVKAALRASISHPELERNPYNIVMEMQPRSFADDDPAAENYSFRRETGYEIIRYLKMIRS